MAAVGAIARIANVQADDDAWQSQPPDAWTGDNAGLIADKVAPLWLDGRTIEVQP